MEDSPAPPIKQPLPRVLKNARIICSHCGVLNHRTITQQSFDEGHDTAYFCSPYCARQNRIAGLGRLTINVRNQVIEMRDGGMQPRAIATQLKLSPLAVTAFLLSRSNPTDHVGSNSFQAQLDRVQNYRGKRGRKTIPPEERKKPGRKPKSVMPEDDIFSDESIARAAMFRELNSDLDD